MSDLVKSDTAEPEYVYDSAEADDDNMTNEERIQYLRDRGITVDLPPSEKEAAQSNSEQKNLVPCFKYVLIPANPKEPYKELTAMLPLNEDGMVPAGDQIPNLVKPCFAGAKGFSSELLNEHARSQLGDQAGAISSRAFEKATIDGSVETFALVRPAKANKFAGVYIYLDEVGVIKQLPPNPRANAIAQACGHASVSFFGDMFVGRVASQPSPMHNIDFLLGDMDSSSKWVTTAPAENYEYSLGMKEVEKALSEKGGNSQTMKVGGFEEGNMPSGRSADSAEGGEGDSSNPKIGSYSWTQTTEDVEVIVPLPVEIVKAKHVNVVIKRSSLLVKNLLKNGEIILNINKLNSFINVDDSTWTLDQSKLMITLEKEKPLIWRLLNADGNEIDE